MFILIPTIIIFLSFSYLYLNENVPLTTQVILYIIMLITIFVSYTLYSKVKKDISLQDINSINIEIIRLTKNINNTKNDMVILGLKKKIELLELEKLNHT